MRMPLKRLQVANIRSHVNQKHTGDKLQHKYPKITIFNEVRNDFPLRSIWIIQKHSLLYIYY